VRSELNLCSTEARRDKVNKEYIRRFRESHAPRLVLNYLIEVPLFKVKKEEKNELNENVKWFSLPFFFIKL
jgi:hypothetical protein